MQFFIENAKRAHHMASLLWTVPKLHRWPRPCQARWRSPRYAEQHQQPGQCAPKAGKPVRSRTAAPRMLGEEPGAQQGSELQHGLQKEDHMSCWYFASWISTIKSEKFDLTGGLGVPNTSHARCMLNLCSKCPVFGAFWKMVIMVWNSLEPKEWLHKHKRTHRVIFWEN